MANEQNYRAGRRSDIRYHPVYDSGLLGAKPGMPAWESYEPGAPDAHLVTPGVQLPRSRWTGLLRASKGYGQPVVSKHVVVVAEIRGTLGAVEAVGSGALSQAGIAHGLPRDGSRDPA